MCVVLAGTGSVAERRVGVPCGVCEDDSLEQIDCGEG